MPRYTGPLRVVQTYENGTIDIAGGRTIKRVNMQRIKSLFETLKEMNRWRNDREFQFWRNNTQTMTETVVMN